MQRTEKYFENDAFRKTAAGVILAAEADAKTGGGRIALDGTVFYPEGGASDDGLVRGAFSPEVLFSLQRKSSPFGGAGIAQR